MHPSNAHTLTRFIVWVIDVSTNPTFRSVAALAGWDAESLLIACFNAEVPTDSSDPRCFNKFKRPTNTLISPDCTIPPPQALLELEDTTMRFKREKETSE
ncbi:hypothetical protein LguiB_011426 [Lonicera macranthoides]